MLLTKPRYYLPASYVLKARAGVASTAVSGHVAETIQGALLKPLTRLIHAPYTPLTRLYSKCFVTRDEALSLLALLIPHYKYCLLYFTGTKVQILTAVSGHIAETIQGVAVV